MCREVALTYELDELVGQIGGIATLVAEGGRGPQEKRALILCLIRQAEELIAMAHCPCEERGSEGAETQ